MEFSYGPTHLDGWEITTKTDEGDIEFSERLTQREKSLTLSKNERGLANLEMVKEITNGFAHGKIFSFGRQWSHHFEGERRINHETVTIEAMIRIRPISYRIFFDLGKAEYIPEIEKIIKQIRFRSDGDLPDEPGFCFKNGYILDPIPTGRPRESTVLFAGYPGRPDLGVALSSISGVAGDKTLLQRAAESELQTDYPSLFGTIFEGARQINGILGEESSERVREMNGTRSHLYIWESTAVKDDVMRPSLSLELGTGIGRPGEPVNSSLSDKEVQALWNQVSGSLRPRPVKTPASTIALGKARSSQSDAGTPCPTAGWWLCEEHVDGYEVLGGTSQYFAAGVRMPQAELYGPANFFGRRNTFVLSTPTRWKLVKEKS